MARPTSRDVHQDAALTNVSIAYRNEEYIADQVFPAVNVTKISDKFYIFDKGAWFRVESRAVRAPGTRAARMDYTLSTGSYVCVEYAFAKGVSDEVRDNSDDPLRPEIEAAEFVTDNLLRAKEKRVGDLVSACANWANSVTPSTKWDDDTSDPLGDVDTARTAILQATGMMPNTMVMGWEVWEDLKNHPDLLDRIKYTERGVLTSDLAAGLFEVNKLLVGRSVYESAEEGETSSMAFIWGKQATLLYVPESPGLMKPASGYVFRFKAREVSRFREDQERQDVFEARHSVSENITGSDAGYVMSAVVS